ncbi:MAG TPA: MFS transporter [Bryobacterales bacterium]|jgi:MFS family permease|nr:MFS transporter [Bryobacterales bacterium]
MSQPEADESSPHISLAAYYRLTRENPNFRRLWLAQIVSELGDWFYSVAVYDLVLRLTGSAQLVGAVVLAQILPAFFLGPTAGAVNDRVSRKAVMITADVLRAGIVLGMLAVRTREQLWLLYVLLIAEVILAAFFEPGRSAVIPNIVEERQVIAANALSAATWSFNLAVGAGLGGLAVRFFGREAAFVLNSLSFLASAALLAGMRFREPHLETHQRLQWLDILGLGPVLEGVRYVRGDLKLMSLLFVKFGLGFVGANLVLLPLMGEREFGDPAGGVLGMSVLFMSRGFGALVGPFIGGRFAGSDQRRMRIGLLAGFLTVGAFYILFSRALTLAAAAACVIAAHSGGSLIWVFSTTLLQLNTEDRFRGRVFAADFGLNMLSASVSAYLTGFAVDHGMALRTTALVTGLAMLLPATAWALAMLRWSRSPEVAPGRAS